MIDQSFSVKNLVDIFNYENDKGNNLVCNYFPEVQPFYEKTRRIKKLIWNLYRRKKSYSSDVFDARALKLYELLRTCKNQKNDLINSKLKHISFLITKNKFNLNVSKLEQQINNKNVYSIGHCVYSFFAEKQIQRNIKKVYGVKQADRDLIIPQIISVLKDKLPKFIIKTDIKSFYESIDKANTIRKINGSPLLSLQSRKILAKLVKSFDGGISPDKGIPRGVGVSAYISELYLKDFDEAIRNMDGLLYYSRYVDDIVAIFSPALSRPEDSYLTFFEKFINNEGLELNIDANKTKVINFEFGGSDNQYSFEYLGYKFKREPRRLKVEISDKKINKYKNKIDAAFNAYNKNVKKQPKKSARELNLRLKFLTNNTKLSNNKNNALVGIFNVNKWINEFGQLTNLDGILRGKISGLADKKLKIKLTNYSFHAGFVNKKYASFSIDDYKSIGSVWRNL